MSFPTTSEGPSEEAAAAWKSTRERRARITWSLIAEPSDAVAMLACAVLGPVDALELARHGSGPDLLRALGGQLPTQASDPGAGNPPARAARALARWRARLTPHGLDEALADAARRGLRIITPLDSEWPRALDDLQESRPHCLWGAGPGTSRSARQRSHRRPRRFAGLHPVRGGHRRLLRGGLRGRRRHRGSRRCLRIDAAAHRGALAADAGATIAILAGGLDRLYPRGNTELLERIRERHLLLSETPPGTAPTRWRFLARNRLIAALSQANDRGRGLLALRRAVDRTARRPALATGRRRPRAGHLCRQRRLPPADQGTRRSADHRASGSAGPAPGRSGCGGRGAGRCRTSWICSAPRTGGFTRCPHAPPSPLRASRTRSDSPRTTSTPPWQSTGAAGPRGADIPTGATRRIVLLTRRPTSTDAGEEPGVVSTWSNHEHDDDTVIEDFVAHLRLERGR